MRADMKDKGNKKDNAKKPPVHKVPDKGDLAEKPKPKKNPSGNRDNEPEEQISG